jgi:hypothetical protein
MISANSFKKMEQNGEKITNRTKFKYFTDMISVKQNTFKCTKNINSLKTIRSSEQKIIKPIFLLLGFPVLQIYSYLYSIILLL